MKWKVVDTNVLVVANGDASHVDQECRVAAKRTLLDIRDRGCLVVDDTWRILREYRRKAGSSGQPGVGGQFFRWAARLSGDVRQVSITCHPQRGFAEFPEDPRLTRFDRKDRKFVATVVAAGEDETELVNAADSDYSHHRTALSEAGVLVSELCPQEILRDR